MMAYPFPTVYDDGSPCTDPSLLACPVFGYQIVSKRNPHTEMFEPLLLLADGTLM